MDILTKPAFPEDTNWITKHHRDFYPFDMNGCVLYLPFYRYGANAQKIWDQSGQQNHGTITGAVPGQYPLLSGVELVTNGGMEAGNPPTGFAAQGTPETFERSGVQKHSGSYAAHIVDSTASYGGIYTVNLPLTYDTKVYKVSYWYYIVSGSLQIQSRLAAFANSYSTTGSWQYGEAIYTPSSASGGDSYIGFYNASNTVAAEFYIDDVSVQEVIGYESRGWSFDGTDDKITLGAWSTFFSVSTGTILTWIRPSVTSKAGASSYGRPTIIGDENGYIWISQGGVPDIGTDRIWVGGSVITEKKYGMTYTPDQWTQITWLHSGNVLYGYKNGVLDGSVACGNIDSIADPVLIGKGAAASSWFKGSVGEVLIFNRALNAQEIQGYYERTRHIYGV